MPNSEKDWVDARVASERLRISVSSVYRLARAGKLESRRNGIKLQFRYTSTTQTPPVTIKLWTSLLAAYDQIAKRYSENPRLVLLGILASILGVFLTIFFYVYPQDKTTPRMSAGEPFRVDYLRIGEAAIDLLSKGEISTYWEEILGGQPFIVPNGVFDELNFLVQNFSTRGDWDEIQISKSQPGKSERYYGAQDVPKLAKRFEKFKDQNLFVGSGSSLTSGLTEVELSDLLDEIKNSENWFLEFDWSVEDGNSAMNFVKMLENGYFEYRFDFIRHSTSKDLAPFKRSNPGNKTFDFYHHVIKNHLPPEFSKLSLKYFSCGSSRLELELDWHPLFLEVAIIENAQSETISVGRFFVKDNSSSHLRKYNEEIKLFERVSQQQVKYFPQKLLKPGEKLLVPLRLVFKSDRAHLSAKDSLKRLDFRLKVLERLQALPSDMKLRAVDPLDKKLVFFEFTVRDWIRILDRDPRKLETDGDFVFGRSVLVQNVEINGQVFDVRQHDPERFVIRAAVTLTDFTERTHPISTKGPT